MCPQRPLRIVALFALSLLTGCAFHHTATDWNGHIGADGKPVFVQTSTYWGLNLLVAGPLAGKTTIEEMVADATSQSGPLDGDRLRIVETESSNYWWSVPPLSWVFSPVLTSISIEYQPSERALAAAERARSGQHSAAPPAPAPSPR
jgi:hypothetical protein